VTGPGDFDVVTGAFSYSGAVIASELLAGHCDMNPGFHHA
jgi:hypothetical protein